MHGDQPALAAECFDRALDYPEGGDYQLWLRGCAYCNSGSYLQGAADFTELLATGEDSVQYMGDRAVAFYVAGYCEKAAEDMRILVRIEPERVNSWQLFLGRALYKAHDVEGAIEAMDEIIAREGDGEYGSVAATRARTWSDGELEGALYEPDTEDLLRK